MGTVVALEVASLLEKLGHQGKIVLIDGSPFLMKMLEGVTSVRNRENFALENALRVRLNEEETRKIMVSSAANCNNQTLMSNKTFRKTSVNAQH